MLIFCTNLCPKKVVNCVSVAITEFQSRCFLTGGTTKSKADSIIRVGFFIFYHLKQLIFSILDIIVEYVSSCLGLLVKSLK